MDTRAHTDIELFAACALSDDPHLWSEFQRRFHRTIALVILRISRSYGADLGTVDELVQETYLKLCGSHRASMRTFVPHHDNAVAGFLRTTAANVAYDHFRREGAIKRGGGRERSADAPDIETVAEGYSPASEKVERSILLQQLQACLGTLLTGKEHKRDRLLFMLYYRHGLTANAIASIPCIGLSQKGVEAALLRMVRLLRERLQVEGRPPESKQEFSARSPLRRTAE